MHQRMLLYTVLLFFPLHAIGKDFVLTPKFITFSQELSTKDILSGLDAAKHLVKRAAHNLDPKDKRYLLSQLGGLVFRLDDSERQMEDLGMKKKRDKRDADAWNPVQVLLAPIIEFLGGESVVHAERDKQDIENLIHILEVNDEKLAGSLKDISFQMAKGLEGVAFNIEGLANATNFVKQVNRIKSHLESIVIPLERSIQTFIEISDRADVNLMSRHVVTEEMLRKMNTIANDRYLSLHPFFPNGQVKKYYPLPIATTGYYIDEQKFKTLVHIPLKRTSDVFQSFNSYPEYIVVENDDYKAMLLHNEVQDCVETRKSVLCWKRTCKMKRRHEDMISSCIFNNEQDSVEIVLKSNSSLKLEIECPGEKKTLFSAEDPVFHLNLPKDCKASNDIIEIEKVVTSKLQPREFAGRAINVNSYKMKDIQRGHPKIRNKATHAVVKNLLQESKNKAKLEETHVVVKNLLQESRENAKLEESIQNAKHATHTHTSIGLGTVIVSAFIILMIFAIVKYCKK